MENSNNFIGRTLGTCTLEKLIGQGGMGAVYLARQAHLARFVAVKVLLPKLTMSLPVYQEFLTRFRREAKLIAKFEHANIMPIHEYGEQDGIAYLVMPYLARGSLRELLAEVGALSLQETLSYIEQAAAALDYAHAHGVVHRDIKPSNFLLHTDGRLVLADFGIARIMQDESSTSGATLTGKGMLLGTPEYMAPEMARGERIDARADIYELGVVLFQMLSGHVPFRGNTPLVVAAKHLQEPLPFLHQINPAIPSSVDAVIQKATAKEREARYLSVGALAYALRVAITLPDYPSESETRNVPTVLSPRSMVVSPPLSPYETPPPIGHFGNFATTPTSDQARGESPYRGPTASISPVTPYPTPKQRGQPWLPFAATLLLIAIILAGTFVGLQIRGSLAITQPTAIATAVNVPPQAPTPTPIPPTPIPPTPAPSPSMQAQATVQQYFTDVNNADYQGAYNIWGANYQSSHPYAGFASGYANTIHDTITFGKIIPLSDGTVQVWVTIQALEQTSSGAVTSIYEGYYIVGQENGAWKFLSAHFSKVG